MTTMIFNFEGACNAKYINLSSEREPMIWQSIRDGVSSKIMAAAPELI